MPQSFTKRKTQRNTKLIYNIANVVMNDQELLNRITLNPDICHGKPTIKGLRYPVESIMEYLSGGDSIQDILAEFSDLEEADVLACLAYATASIKAKSVIIFPFAA